MSPLVRRALVTFHLKQALIRLERREPLGPIVMQLFEALMSCFEDTDEPVV